MVNNGSGAHSQGVSCLSYIQLRHSADISSMELLQFHLLLASQGINLADLLLCVFVYIIGSRIRLQCSGTYLHQRIFTDKRVNDGLKDSHGQRYAVVILSYKTLACGHVHTDALKAVRRREITVNSLQKHSGALTVNAGTQHDRNNTSIYNMFPQSRGDLLVCKFFSGKIPLHVLLACLCHCLYQSFPGNAKILLGVFGNLAFYVITVGGKSSSCHLYHIHKSHKLLILTNRQMERRYLSAESGLQLKEQFTEAGMIVIHIGHKNDAGKVKLLTELPRFLRSHFNACLAVHHNHCRVGNTDGLFHFAYKVKVAGSI